MIKDKVISISDLRTHATQIINSLDDTGDKYIFVHNKPKAVLVSVDWFETVSQKYNKQGIENIDPDSFERQAIKEYEGKKQNGDLTYTDAFTLLESLK